MVGTVRPVTAIRRRIPLQRIVLQPIDVGGVSCNIGGISCDIGRIARDIGGVGLNLRPQRID
ncbi:hypothetical protein D3C77_428800 [compost metagenome]